LTVARQRVAIVGFGRLGRACAEAIRETADLELAGIVRRAGSVSRLPAPLEHVAVATHLRDLGRADAALLCVPPPVATDAARGILQLRMPLVECAMLDGRAREAHYEALRDAAHHHRVAAIVGAGWDPGMLPLLRRAFDLLIPNGRTVVTARPGVSLHHTEAAQNTPGIRAALATESRGADGRLTRYVYAELANGADAAAVQAALAADPLFAGEETLLFPVESIAALEEEGHGCLLERRGTARSGAHQNLLLEARFDVATFAARVMLDAARRLWRLAPRAHRYSLSADAEAVAA
jgi:diaminopimelate dehydrogenase